VGKTWKPARGAGFGSVPCSSGRAHDGKYIVDSWNAFGSSTQFPARLGGIGAGVIGSSSEVWRRLGSEVRC